MMAFLQTSYLRFAGNLIASAMSFVIATTSVGICDDASAVANISFSNDIVPVLTKAGCNTGACHAKAGGGQNGFQLSLLGFEHQEDYESLVKEGRGRRLFRSSPKDSLLLRKISGQLPHGGGIRLAQDSTGYQLLLNWIQQGTPFKTNSEPVLESLQVTPGRLNVAMHGRQQLTATAGYSDGSTRDVTQMALYESNDEAMSSVSDGGLVTINDIPGNAAVMVRYQGKVAVFNAAIPLGADIDQLPAPNNFVDDYVFANLKSLGIPPSAVCDDSTFLRRVCLDIAGRLPTSQETQVFLANNAADKRNMVIDRLLQSPGYADFFANKWTTLLKNRRDDASDITSNFAFHAWIRDSLLANVPYDQIVRELLAATGTVIGNPPVAWYKRVKEPKQQLEDVAQLFLGVRLQCAQCHHHPFERWSQDDYYSLSAFFTQIGRKPTGTRGEDMIFHRRGIAKAKNVKTGIDLLPRAFGDDVGKIAAGHDPRLKLADWMAQPDNPFFAKALVNRYWKHFFKRGLIEPEDDIRDTNPPTNPELLSALENHFHSSKFDLKDLVRVIVQSKSYQLSSQPNEQNIIDRQNYSRYYPRRLQAEVMLDAIDDLTAVKTAFTSLPAGTRAVALPDNSYNKQSAFLRVFGRPDSFSVCECERVQSSSLAQSLHFINSSEIKAKLTKSDSRASQLLRQDGTLEEKIEQVYMIAFARKPTASELQTATDYFNEPLADADGKPIPTKTAARQNFQDLIWALMNTKEFLFNH